MKLKDIVGPEAIAAENRLCDIDVNLERIIDFGNECAFISGSVVERLGNETSDVDIYVVTKEQLIRGRKKLAYNVPGKHYYIEINQFTFNYLKRLNEKIDRLSNTRFHNSEISLVELEHYYRVAIGVPLFNKELFEKIADGFYKEKVNTIFEKYYYNAAIYSLKLSKTILDFDVERACFYAQKAFENSVDYYLAKNQEGYASDKYRYAKLKRLLGGENDEMYIRSWNLRSFSGDEALGYISGVVEYCDNMQVCCNDETNMSYELISETHKVNVIENYVIQDNLYVFRFSQIHEAILQLILDGVTDFNSICKMTNISNQLVYNYLFDLEKYGFTKLKEC